MAQGCNPAQKIDNVQEGFTGYLSNKSCSMNTLCYVHGLQF